MRHESKETSKLALNRETERESICRTSIEATEVTNIDSIEKRREHTRSAIFQRSMDAQEDGCVQGDIAKFV